MLLVGATFCYQLDTRQPISRHSLMTLRREAHGTRLILAPPIGVTHQNLHWVTNPDGISQDHAAWPPARQLSWDSWTSYGSPFQSSISGLCSHRLPHQLHVAGGECLLKSDKIACWTHRSRHEWTYTFGDGFRAKWTRPLATNTIATYISSKLPHRTSVFCSSSAPTGMAGSVWEAQMKAVACTWVTGSLHIRSQIVLDAIC